MTPSAIHIREATLDDAPEIMRHRRLMFRDMGFVSTNEMRLTQDPGETA